MDTASIAVWDVPLPVIAGERFAIKVGVKSGSGSTLTGTIEVCDSAGKTVASGKVGGEPWPGTESLHWVALNVPAPAEEGLAEFTVRYGDASSRFSVAAVAKPEHRLAMKITETGTAAPLGDVEIRLGAFHARTDAKGCAELHVCKGTYRLQVWRNAYESSPRPIEIGGDTSIEIEMLHVPEDHPDARWVR